VLLNDRGRIYVRSVTLCYLNIIVAIYEVYIYVGGRQRLEHDVEDTECTEEKTKNSSFIKAASE